MCLAEAPGRPSWRHSRLAARGYAVGIAATRRLHPEGVGDSCAQLRAAVRLCTQRWDRLACCPRGPDCSAGQAGERRSCATTGRFPDLRGRWWRSAFTTSAFPARPMPALWGPLSPNRALDITKPTRSSSPSRGEPRATASRRDIDKKGLITIPHGLTHTPSPTQVEIFHHGPQSYPHPVGRRAKPRKNLLRAYRAMASSDLNSWVPAGWGEDPSGGPDRRTPTSSETPRRLPTGLRLCRSARGHVSIWEGFGLPVARYGAQRHPPSSPAPTPVWRESRALTRVSSCRPPMPSPTPWRRPPKRARPPSRGRPRPRREARGKPQRPPTPASGGHPMNAGTNPGAGLNRSRAAAPASSSLTGKNAPLTLRAAARSPPTAGATA